MKVEEIAGKIRVPMTDFEIKNFVIGQFYTLGKMLLQLSVETDARVSSRKETEREIRRTEIRKKMLLRKLEQEKDLLEQELIEIDIEELNDALEELNGKLDGIDYELKTFQNILDKLTKEYSEDKIKELMKPENIEKEEIEYWAQRLSRQAGNDIIATGTIQTGNMDAILNLPENLQDVVVKLSALKARSIEDNVEVDRRLALKVSEPVSFVKIDSLVDKINDALVPQGKTKHEKVPHKHIADKINK